MTLPSPPPSSPRREILMPTVLVARTLAYVRSRGGDADGLIRRFELSPRAERDPVTVIPLPRLHALLEAAERETDDPAMGAHIAERAEGSALALMELACSGVPTLRAAVERYVGHVSSWNDELPITVEPRGGGIVLKQHVRATPLCLGRHGNEHWLVAVLQAGRQVTGAPCVPVRAWLAHAGTAPHPELVRLVGTSHIELGAGFNGVEVSAAVLDTPLRPAAAKLSTLAERYAAFAAAEGPRPSPLDGRLREVLRDRLPSGVPSIGVVARALGTSGRTLQRRLAEEGLSFQGVIDGLRADLARAYVRTARLSVSELAARLGYAQPSAFVRAFKRWTGSTPKQLRGGDGGEQAEG